MRYLLAIVLPPLAVLSCGKPFQATLNLVLTLCLWIPGVVHALFVVSNQNADRRNRELIDAIAGKPGPSSFKLGHLGERDGTDGIALRKRVNSSETCPSMTGCAAQSISTPNDAALSHRYLRTVRSAARGGRHRV